MIPAPADPRVGVEPLATGGAMARFWAPRCRRLEIAVDGGAILPLAPGRHGWWQAHLPALAPGTRYRLRLDGQVEIPDPLSRYQPQGVHGPSEAVDLEDFPWTDAGWRGVPLTELVIYEIHLGTYTPEGTCSAAIAHLDALVDLGVTAIELMPVAQCPGERNWGYDGVQLFAVQHSVGGPRDLQRLVDACHARGIAVLLDVVYNHLGPEGDHTGDLMPFTTDDRRTPWGPAVNVDGRQSDGVRTILMANVRQWLERFHIDGLRLDAVHLIPADGATPFITALAAAVDAWAGEWGRPLHLVAEAGTNASRYVRGRDRGGYGLASQWADDFHHALHVLLTGEQRLPYNDFGAIEHLHRAYARGFVYDGRWCESREQTWGDDASDLSTERFVVFAQNHDQIGNRLLGDRLARLTDAAGLRCAAGAVLLSPYLPLLFMGEEWGERAPFLFFVDHDPTLADGVRRSRREQFGDIFGSDEPPDPFSVANYAACRLDHGAAECGPGRTLRAWYRACLQARRTLPSLRPGPRARIATSMPHPAVIAVERRHADCRTLLLVNATPRPAAEVALPEGHWRIALASSAREWGGPDAPAGAPERTVDVPPRTVLLLRDAVPGP